MTRSEKRQLSIAAILLLTLIAALLIALPRLTAGAELHPTTILWFVTLHQIAIAATLATILWVLFARRTYVAVLLTTLIVVLWGPITTPPRRLGNGGCDERSLLLGRLPGLGWGHVRISSRK